MIRRSLLTFVLILAAASAFAADQPPMAKQVPHELTLHGDTRVDPFYWLNQREDPEVIAYLEAENAWTEQQMADTEELQAELFEEIKGRIKQDDSTVPYRWHGHYYYSRYEEGRGRSGLSGLLPPARIDGSRRAGDVRRQRVR
jgi:oligopeptidase B